MSAPSDENPDVRSVPTPQADKVGKYHIVKPLKLGGTAAIYLAVMRGENNFSREVVIKRPLPHLVAEGRSRHMFIDEAHIASRLSHPNVCQVLDLVAREDELYIVLEYLRGVDLREVLKRCIHLGRMVPPDIAVWLAVEVAAGLDYAHHATTVDGSPLNLVHRDVSPKNIRVTFEGAVKVIDFGIARAEHRITRTSSGTIKGTLGYMSPEQILGDDIDRRSDIFAFGIVLFQTLTLRNPFDGPSLKERVRKLTQAPIPSVKAFNAELDDDLAEIVARCLERDVADRYQRLRDAQVALDRYLARLQVVSSRQRLIDFLADIFPKFDEFDADLKAALFEVSHSTGRVDASVRLLFPDDPPTASMTPQTDGRAEVPTVRPTAGGERDPVGVATRPSRTVRSGVDRTVAPTAPSGLAPGPVGVGVRFDEAETRPPARPWSDPGTADTRPIREPRPQPPPPPGVAKSEGAWAGRLGLAALAMAAAVVVTVLVSPPRRVVVTPVVKSPPSVESSGGGTSTGPLRAAPPPKLRPGDVSAAAGSAQMSSSEPSTAAKKSLPAARKPAKNSRLRPATIDRDRARLMFQTAVRLKKQGRVDDATLMYELAYAYSASRPDPALFLNLGLLHNEQGRDERAKACLRGYLDRRPAAPQADRVRTLIASFPPLPTVPCVDRAAVSRARKAETRRGAQIRRWMDDTLGSRLQ